MTTPQRVLKSPLTLTRKERGNSVRTRNARLSAVHSLFGYAAPRHPRAVRKQGTAYARVRAGKTGRTGAVTEPRHGELRRQLRVMPSGDLRQRDPAPPPRRSPR